MNNILIELNWQQVELIKSYLNHELKQDYTTNTDKFIISDILTKLEE